MAKKIVAKKPAKTHTAKPRKEEVPMIKTGEVPSVSELPTPQEPVSVVPPVVKLVVEQEPGSPPQQSQPETGPIPTPVPPVEPATASIPVTQQLQNPNITVVDGFTTSSETPEKAGRPVTDDEFEPEGNGGGVVKVIVIFLTALLVGGGAVAGFFYYSKQQSQETPQVQETPTPTQPVVSEENEATDSADTEEVNLAAISIQILNGSGIAGEAGRVQELLKAEGFETFTLGNAGSYNYTDTEVQVKEGTPAAVFEAISESLEAYTIVEETALPETSDYDVVITVGQKK